MPETMTMMIIVYVLCTGRDT